MWGLAHNIPYLHLISWSLKLSATSVSLNSRISIGLTWRNESQQALEQQLAPNHNYASAYVSGLWWRWMARRRNTLCAERVLDYKPTLKVDQREAWSWCICNVFFFFKNQQHLFMHCSWIMSNPLWPQRQYLAQHILHLTQQAQGEYLHQHSHTWAHTQLNLPPTSILFYALSYRVDCYNGKLGFSELAA